MFKEILQNNQRFYIKSQWERLKHYNTLTEDSPKFEKIKELSLEIYEKIKK
jgi:hypothetical protein